MFRKYKVVTFLLMLGVFFAHGGLVPNEASAESSVDTYAVEDLDNLEFASGEATTFDASTGKLGIKVYLDDAGNPAESVIELTVKANTEITNGEADLDATSLKKGVEIDVEYDKRTLAATYIFVY